MKMVYCKEFFTLGFAVLLEFDFDYVSENDFFEYLVHFYAQTFVYQVEKSPFKLKLSLEANEEQMREFCDKLENMPNSVFLRGFKVKTIENKSIQPRNLSKNFAKKDFLTNLNLKAYQEKGQLCENEWGIFVQNELSFDNKTFQSLDKTNFNTLLNESLAKFKAFQSVFVKDECGIYEVKLMNEKFSGDFAMPTDIKAIKTAFVCTNENLKLLASLEKPLVKLRFSALFRQNHALKINEFKLKLPHNLFFFALALKLFEENFHFLSFTRLEKFSDEFEVFECDKKLIVLRGFEYINQRAKELILSKDDKNIARISYLLSRFDKAALLLELSQSYDDILLINKETNLLKLHLPRNASQLYEALCADELGKKLFENYQKKFPLLEGEFEVKNNFFSLFGLIGQMLKLDNNTQKAAKRLLELSDKSKMPRGVKIDFKLNTQNKEFDYAKTLRSVMSFLLANVDAENIAFSAVESLVYFLRDFYDDLRLKGQAKIAIISGSLFECRSLSKNTLKHLQNSLVCDVPLWV